MENEITSEADYQKGFNEGYLITKHMSELSKQLADIKSEAPRLEGFRDGREEFMLEKEKELLPPWMKRDFKKKDNREPDLDKE